MAKTTMKIHKLPSGDIKYSCICGKELTLSHAKDDSLKKLIKCFECIEKEALSIEDIRNFKKGEYI